MLYAWIDGIKRQPLTKGEKAICDCCNGILTSVIPVQNVKHWRHKAGDCDKWSEPEGQWHLDWKEHFDLNCREIGLIDERTGERHRADILCGLGTPEAIVLELQHSSISEEERLARENFYQQNHKMFWLVHIHNENSFNVFSFGQGLSLGRELGTYDGRTFFTAHWASRSSQFIQKWKRSTAHVFFDFCGDIFYLANENICRSFGKTLDKSDFVVCRLSRREFINAVHGIKRGN